MAISIYTGLDEEYGLAEQSTWGTAITDGANFNSDTSGSWAREISVERADLVPGVNLRRPNRARAFRYPYLPDLGADTKGREHVFNFRGPFLNEYGSFLLYGLLQSVTQSATSNDAWQKTHVANTSQPDFSNNAGMFFTLVEKTAVSSTSKKIHDAIFRSMSLSARPGDGEEAYLMVDGQLVGRQYAENSDPSGTYTPPSSQTYFSFYDLATKTIAGTDVVIGDGGISLNLSNNAKPIGGTNALFETFLISFSGQLEMNVLWDSTVRTQMSNWRAGTAAEVILEWGSSGSDGHLKFTLEVVWDAAAVDNAEEGKFVTLTGTLGKTSGGSVPITVLHSDNVDRGF